VQFCFAGEHEQIAALDQDFSPSSATPSVKLLIDLPAGTDRISQSNWYTGSVFVTVKDATL
jgi:hypothetical protein